MSRLYFRRLLMPWILLIFVSIYLSSSSSILQNPCPASASAEQAKIQQQEQQEHEEEVLTSFSNVPSSTRRRRPPGNANCLVFFHIQKTAGSTAKELIVEPMVREGLKWNYTTYYGDFTKKLPPGSTDDISPRQSKNFEASLLLNESWGHMGHLTPRFLNETQTERCKLVTLLREPIDRVVSAFYYHGHNTTQWDDCLFRKQKKMNMSSHRQGGSCKYQWQLNNDVVRILAGQGDTWNTYHEERYVVSVNEGSLQLAQHFLADMDLVCFQDDLVNCRRELCKLLLANNIRDDANGLGCVAANNIAKRNVNGGRPAVDEIILNKVRAMNRLDIELYQWALAQNFSKARLVNKQ